MMKFLSIIALLALLGCASNKPKNDARECEALFARIEDLQKMFQERGREEEFEARYRMLTEMPFPSELEDGTIVNCHEKITCDGTDYCIIVEVGGHWGWVL